MATKWSIVGSGRICNDFVLCLRSLPINEHQIIAVADLNLQNAQTFASKHRIPKCYGSFEELANDPDFDIAYIGMIHPFHFEASKSMLEGNKHVLCEKPLCMNLKQTEELIAIARQRNRFLMEAMWSRFLPIYEKIKEEIEKGSIGTPNLIDAWYYHPTENYDRMIKYNLGGGVVLDPGIYPIQLTVWIFGREWPEKITVEGHLNEDGVEEVAIITLLYSNERVASIRLSLRTVFHSGAFIVGTKGIIKIPNPLNCPTSLETPNKNYEIPMPKISGEFVHGNTEGLVFEAKKVRECLQKGLLECPLMPLDETRLVAAIMEDIRRKINSSE